MAWNSLNKTLKVILKKERVKEAHPNRRTYTPLGSKAEFSACFVYNYDCNLPAISDRPGKTSVERVHDHGNTWLLLDLTNNYV